MAIRSRGIAQTVTATAAGVAMLYFLRAILIPLVLAGVVAVLVNGLMRFIGGRSRRAPHGAIVALTALIVIVSVVGAILIVAKGMVQVVQQVPALLALIDQLVQQAGYALRLREALTLQSLIGDLDVPRLVGRVAGSAGNLFSGLVLLVTFFGFIVAGRRRTSRKIERLAGTADASASVEADLRQIAATVETYVWVQTVTGLMVAAASGVVMLAAGQCPVLDRRRVPAVLHSGNRIDGRIDLTCTVRAAPVPHLVAGRSHFRRNPGGRDDRRQCHLSTNAGGDAEYRPPDDAGRSGLLEHFVGTGRGVPGGAADAHRNDGLRACPGRPVGGSAAVERRQSDLPGRARARS
jgi:hypothetical protein